jgi:2-hydroxy-3-keto-5-methylthiopentenyl-1-phosphate phosphatase
MQTRLPLVLVIDFDGTVTDKDIGDELCERFAPPEWKAIDDAWVRNEITLPEAQRRMWALCRAERAEAIEHARAVGHRRPGLAGLLSAVNRLGGEVWLASGGFDFYVEALLGEEGSAFARRYYNGTRFADGGVEVSFPHTELHCDRCAVCKGKVCDLARTVADRVIFVGDGSSDRCVVGHCDEIFAVRGGILDRHCASVGAAATRFSSLDEVAGDLGLASTPRV